MPAETPFTVGMEVCIDGSRGIYTIKKVQKVGKIHVVLDDGSKWKLSGRQVGGDGWHFSRIVPMTDELRVKFADAKRRSAAFRVIDATDFRKLSTSQLERIVAVIEEKQNG